MALVEFPDGSVRELPIEPAKPQPRLNRKERNDAIREAAKPCECCGRGPMLAELAKRFNVSQSTVSRVISGKATS